MLKKIEQEKNHETLSFRDCITKQHPYNLGSSEKKLGFTGLGLAVLLGLWVSSGWKVALPIAIIIEAIVIILWDCLEYYLTPSNAEKKEEIEIQSEKIENKEDQVKSLEIETKKLIQPVLYSIIMTVTLSISLSIMMNAL